MKTMRINCLAYEINQLTCVWAAFRFGEAAPWRGAHPAASGGHSRGRPFARFGNLGEGFGNTASGGVHRVPLRSHRAVR